MMPCGTFIRTFPCFVILFCVGCGHGLFSFGADSASVALPATSAKVSSEPAPAVPPIPEKKLVRYETGTGYDRSYHRSVLTEDVTWSGTVLVRGGLTIAPHATLNIKPGTVVSFIPDPNDQSEGVLLVRGRIAAVGSADQPILFKAATTTTTPGSWRGIIVLGSDKRNLFERCRIEGASISIDAVFSTVSLENTFFDSCGTGVRLQNSLLQARGGGATGCTMGYALIDSEADIRNASCSGNGLALSLLRGSLFMKDSFFSGNTGHALEALDARVMISGSTFEKNTVGLSFSGTDGSLENSRIVENREYGVQLIRSRMKIFGNYIYMNTGVGVMTDTGGSAAWGNTISLNGLHDIYNAGTEDFRAIGNWWGVLSDSSRQKRIYDRSVDSRRGKVLTMPELFSPPVQYP